MTIPRRRIQHVNPGERVDAGVTSRPTQQLEQAVNELQDQLNLLIEGEALALRQAVLNASCVVGTPVYWEAGALRFSPAFPAVSYETTTGAIITLASARARGIVFFKDSSTLGTVVIRGKVQLDLSAVIVGTGGAGLYYLHPTLPGKLTKLRPAMAVAVVEVLGDGNIFVDPETKYWADEHVHVRRDLVCAPAGDHSPPGGGGTHSITGADVNLAGWLPANHASFNSLAPAGASFGYNLNADPGTAALWPPTPDSMCLIWDKGANRLGGTELPLGTGGAAIIDTNGIWWLPNCNADVPWPNETFVDGVSTATPASPGCPRPETMRLKLYLARATLSTSKSLVTSLRTPEGGVLTITDCDGNPADRGDLVITASLELLQAEEEDEAGYVVMKRIGDDGKILRGPVVEGIKFVGDNFTVTASETDEAGFRKGLVSVAFDADPASKEFRPDIIALDQARERTLSSGFVVVAFEAAIRGTINCAFHVPAAGIAADTAMRLRLTAIGTAAGALPALTITYRIIPRGTVTPAAIPATETSLSLGSMPTLAAANTYVELQTGTFLVDPGDHIAIRIQRAHNDAYNGEVQLLDLLLV